MFVNFYDNDNNNNKSIKCGESSSGAIETRVSFTFCAHTIPRGQRSRPRTPRADETEDKSKTKGYSTAVVVRLTGYTATVS